MGRLRIFVAIALAAAGGFPGAADAAFRADFYSEQAYLGRENVIVNQVRVRGSSDSTALLVPYLQVGSELMTAGSTGGDSLDPGSSYAYGAPGARLALGKVSLFGEARFRKFYNERPSPLNEQHLIDLRGVLVFGDFADRRIGSDTSPVFLFTELYGELVYTSADFHNVIFAGFARAGLRVKPTATTAFDLFLEPFVTFDRMRHYYNNRADLKPSLRFLFFAGRFNMSLIGSYITNTYFSRGTFDPNPYAGVANGVRGLAVFGVTL